MNPGKCLFLAHSYRYGDTSRKVTCWRSPLALALFCVLYIYHPSLFRYPLYRYLSPSDYTQSPTPTEYYTSPVAVQRYKEGIAKCDLLNTTSDVNKADGSWPRKNPRASLIKNDTFIIRNATLFDGSDWIQNAVDVLISDGIIKEIDQTIHSDQHVNFEINAMGRFLTPGLVDMHSHSTLYPLPATKDYIELFDLMSEGTEFVRVIDSMFPSDPMVPIIASGGVTTSLILPGSTNIIGGQGLAIKNRVPESLSVVEMQVEYDIDRPQRYLKMACGFNPKAFHSDIQKRPNSRMGIAWWWRNHFDKAKKLGENQQMWCEKAYRMHNKTGAIEKLGSYPEDDKLEMAIGALRGDVKIHVHCSASQDIEALLRIADEFDFQIEAIHHGNDAHLIPGIIKKAKNRITLAIWAFFGLNVMENFRTSIYGGKILSDHDIPVAYKSDHPWVNAKHLIYEAAIGHSVGLNESIALRAVTSTPAKAIGLDHRLGYVRVGYDADLVLWDSHPLQLGATPIGVWIDGVALYNVTKANPNNLSKECPKMRAIATSKKRSGCEEGARYMVVNGLQKTFLKIPGINSQIIENGEEFQIVINKGKIVCIGRRPYCSLQADAAKRNGARELDLNEGYLVPGVTALSRALGLSEIDFEVGTQDGAFAPASPFSPASVPYSKYGISFGGKHMRLARGGGVLNSVTAPNNLGQASGPPTPMRGISAAFRTGGKNVLERFAIQKEEVAMHIVIGHSSQANGDRPISTQIASLRESLIENSGLENEFGRVYSGNLPLVVETNNEGVIAQLLKLKKEFSKIRLVIHGGAEAWRLSKELAAFEVPVILAPWRCTPWTWEERHCLPGPPQTESGIKILHEAGVMLGIAMTDDALISRLWIEAGWAKVWGNMTELEAVNLISYNIEDILGLKKFHDPVSNFILFEGNPLKFGARIAVIVEQRGDKVGVVDCWPELE